MKTTEKTIEKMSKTVPPTAPKTITPTAPKINCT